MELLQFALHAWQDADLPSAHKGAGYEEPLFAVMVARYEEMGSRLKDVDAAAIRADTVGFFKFSPTAPDRVTCIDGSVVNLNISSEFMRTASDWKIENGMSIDQAALRSDSLDTMFELWPKHERQFPNSGFGHFSEGFEMPEAATQFPDGDGNVEHVSPSTPGSSAGVTSVAASVVGSPAEVRIGARSSASAAPPPS